VTERVEQLARLAIDCGLKVHQTLGPGLLETVHEACLEHSLASRGLYVQRQVPVPVRFGEIILSEGFRADLLVEGKLLIELKSTEKLAPVHGKQLLTYLRLMDLPLGLLMNFGAATFKEGLRRVANNYYRTAV
jgi:GxxExxY protein